MPVVAPKPKPLNAPNAVAAVNPRIPFSLDLFEPVGTPDDTPAAIPPNTVKPNKPNPVAEGRSLNPEIVPSGWSDGPYEILLMLSTRLILAEWLSPFTQGLTGEAIKS